MNQSKEVDLPQKVLIVDDELGKNQSDREDFISALEISENLVLFATSFDEAISIIQSNSGIVVAFVDCRIPKSNGLYDFDPLNTGADFIEWGLSLIPEINQAHHLAQIVIYSCYVKQSYLVEKAERYNNIIGFYNKSEGILQRKMLYLSAIDEVKKLLTATDSLIISPQTIDVKAITDEGFDYSSLDPKLARWLQVQTIQIKKLLRRTTQDIVDTGKYMKKVKDSLQHGQYEKWVKDEVGVSPPTAYRYIRVYESLHRVGIENVSKLSIMPTALYEITGIKVPDEALIEMKSLAESGIEINTAVAQNLAQKYIKADNTKPIGSSADLKDKEQANKAISPSSIKGDSSRVRSLSPNLDSPVSQQETSNVPNNIVKVVRRQDLWDLGKHKLFRAEPNDSRFLEDLPKNIVLGLIFVPQKTWYWNSSNFKSQMVFYTEYVDLDYIPLLEAVKKVIEITTNDGDAIAVCFCPYPEIVGLVSELGCQAYIAEPDYDKCLAIAQKFLEKYNK